MAFLTLYFVLKIMFSRRPVGRVAAEISSGSLPAEVPDPSVLESIVSDLGIEKSDSVYIGDSLMKDVAMAIDCGISDVWAKYGQAHKRPEYKLLQDVTHWTTEEVQREQKIGEREGVRPTNILENTFSELLDSFEFEAPHGR
jgi:phosphoglycolate phosphatase